MPDTEVHQLTRQCRRVIIGATGGIMTAEVCIMNRHAAVLAADSATTVSRWVDGKQEFRYFKGANKIFQLSHHHPVGVMIFNSADFMRVPWELLIKTFRDDLGSKSFNNLQGYVDEFLGWLDENPRFFPEDVQRETFIGGAKNAAARACRVFRETLAVDEAEDLAVVVRKLDEWMPQRLAELRDALLGQRLDAEKLDGMRATWKAPLLEAIREMLVRADWPVPGDLDTLTEIALFEAAITPHDYFSTAGLVFAGYGDHDVFPAMVEYESAGLIGGTAVMRRLRGEAIDHEVPASLTAFAQTGMADTFQLGFSVDIYSAFMDNLRDCMGEFAAELCEKVNGDAGQLDDIPARTEALCDRISDAVFERARREHSFPLRQVLGVLPVDEMAELAETLINLQSLKEKVTKPSASVGGPIDVAIITRHEGLVWVKRKKFFEADLNPRYMLRQQALHR